jgi:ketosteroid isomerase-like protein
MINDKFDRTLPEGTVQYFRSCILAGDLMGALSCFHEDAKYIERDGREIKGADNIAKSLEPLCNWRPEITGENYKVVIVGDLAIWMDNYLVSATLPDGTPINSKGMTSCMMIRNGDGIWFWLVDNPFAGELLQSNPTIAKD